MDTAPARRECLAEPISGRVGHHSFELSHIDSALAEVENIAPEEISAAVTTMAEENRAQVAAGPPTEGAPPNIPSGEFFTGATAVGDYMAEGRGYQVINVTATDYAFDGIPADAEAGKTLIRITNERCSRTARSRAPDVDRRWRSYLALADLRKATKDIDTVTRLTESMREAIEEVAAMLDLPPLWLNDQAAMFRPTGLNEHHCHVEYAGQTLTMLVPSPDWIFLMKLYAARAIDRPDMIRLWPHTGFASPGQAVERYWDAYPHAREDDHLESFVAAIAKSAAGA